MTTTNSRAYWIFIATIASCILLASAPSEVYLPAMPQLCLWFNSTQIQLQATVSVYFFGLVAAQIVAGPIIDRYNYRHVALGAIILFIVASLVCALATTLSMLIIARLFQAMAGGACAVVGRASLAKRFDAAEIVRAYYFISPLIALSFCISPFIGGYLTQWFDWRSIFYFLIIMSIILFFLVKYFLILNQKPEDAISLHPLSIIKTYFSLFYDRTYSASVLAASAIYATFFAFVIETPFMLSTLHYDSADIGKFYIFLSLMFVLASWVVRRFLQHLGFKVLVFSGLILEIIAALSLYEFAYPNLHSMYQLAIPSIVMGFANGTAIPSLFGKSVSIFPRKSGYAAAVMSASTLLAAALATATTNIITQGSILYLSLLIGGLQLAALIIFFLLMRSHLPNQGMPNAN